MIPHQQKTTHHPYY